MISDLESCLIWGRYNIAQRHSIFKGVLHRRKDNRRHETELLLSVTDMPAHINSVFLELSCNQTNCV